MAINQKLVEKLRAKLGVKKSRLYQIIQTKANTAHLPHEVAAIALAAENGINIRTLASDEDLAIIRSAAAKAAPVPVALPTAARIAKTSTPVRRQSKPKKSEKSSKIVFVVHGRDHKTRDELFALLKAFKLTPLEWNEAIKRTKKAAPYVGEILDVAFKDAAAIVVLLTPDDLAKLKPKFHSNKDHSYETTLFGQARPNVIFEAGMALGRKDGQTVLVQVGMVKPFSDVGGRHIVQLNNSFASKQQLAIKLRNAGCDVDDSNKEWPSAGDFGG